MKDPRSSRWEDRPLVGLLSLGVVLLLVAAVVHFAEPDATRWIALAGIVLVFVGGSTHWRGDRR